MAALDTSKHVKEKVELMKLQLLYSCYYIILQRHCRPVVAAHCPQGVSVQRNLRGSLDVGKEPLVRDRQTDGREDSGEDSSSL